MLVRQLFSFGLVGVVNTLFCGAVLALGAWLGLHYTVYTAIGYTLAILLSFVLNRHFTFNQKTRTRRRLVRFLGVSFGLLGVVELLQILLIEAFRLPHLPAILAGMATYTFTGFFFHKYYTFR